MSGFRREHEGLTPIAVSVLAGMVFVNLSMSARDLNDELADMRAIMDGSCQDFAGFHHQAILRT